MAEEVARLVRALCVCASSSSSAVSSMPAASPEDLVEQLRHAVHACPDLGRTAALLFSSSSSSSSAPGGLGGDFTGSSSSSNVNNSGGPGEEYQWNVLQGFLLRNLREKDRAMDTAKTKLLKLIAEFVRICGAGADWVTGRREMAPYAVRIVAALRDVFVRETQVNTVRAATLKPIGMVLRMQEDDIVHRDKAEANAQDKRRKGKTTHADEEGDEHEDEHEREEDGHFQLQQQRNQGAALTTLTAAAVDTDGMVQDLLEVLFHQKHAAGTWSEIVKLLGILVYIFPEEPCIVQNAERIMTACMRTLEQQFASNSPSLPMMAGAFSCLDRCLFHYAHRFSGNNSIAGKNLFRFMATGLSSLPNIARFAMPSKVLRLLSNHAPLFRAHIGRNATKLFPLVQDCARHNTPTLRKHSLDALSAVVQQVAHSASQQDHKALLDLARRFVSTLENPTTMQRNDVDVAVAGITALGPRIGPLLGAERARQIALKLAECCDVVLTSMGDDASAAITSLAAAHAGLTQRTGAASVTDTVRESANVVVARAQFLGALAAIIHGLPAHAVDTTLLDRATPLATATVVGFPRIISDYNREVGARSIVMYIAALHTSDDALCMDALQQIVPVGLARTVSRLEQLERVGYALTDPRTGEQQSQLYPAYIALWTAVIRPTHPRTLRFLEPICPNYHEVVGPTVYGALLAETNRTLNKLNLAYEVVRAAELQVIAEANAEAAAAVATAAAAAATDGTDSNSSSRASASTTQVLEGRRGPSNTSFAARGQSHQEALALAIGGATNHRGDMLQPAAPIDQELLLNLVSFGEGFWPFVRPDILANWIPILVLTAVQHSVDRPHVSALYRLIGTVFQVANVRWPKAQQSAFRGRSPAGGQRAGHRRSAAGGGEQRRYNTVAKNDAADAAVDDVSDDDDDDDDDSLDESVADPDTEAEAEVDVEHGEEHKSARGSKGRSRKAQRGGSGVAGPEQQQQQQEEQQQQRRAARKRQPIGGARGDMSDVEATNSWLACLGVLQSYVAGVGDMLPQFSDELLASALSMVLRAPSPLVDRSTLQSTLQVALRTGISYTPCATVALDALERWFQCEPQRIGELLPEVLPLLDMYVTTSARTSAETRDAISLTWSDARMRKGKQGKRASRRRAAASNRDGGEGWAEFLQHQGLDKVRGRVLRFLGRLGGLSHLMLPTVEHALGEATKWTAEGPVQVPLIVTLPSPPGVRSPAAMQLNMGTLLPRVIELATQRFDRQVRSLASETFHALLVYIVGHVAVDPSRGADAIGADASAPAGRHVSVAFPLLFRAVIDLAVDVEQVARQLFEGLLMQLVHWYANSRRELNDCEETRALLDSLVRGACNAESADVRDVCATGMAEFFKYAIKHTSKHELAQADGKPFSVDGLLNRLIQLATHPDKGRRFGAAATLVKIHRIFREETPIVKQYALLIVYSLYKSLHLGHGDVVAHAARHPTLEALARYLKIVVGTVFKGDRAKLCRELSRPFPSSLDALVSWVWHRTGSREAAFRQACQQGFLALCPLLTMKSVRSGLSSSSSSSSLSARQREARECRRQWVANWLHNHANRIASIVESSLASNRPHVRVNRSCLGQRTHGHRAMEAGREVAHETTASLGGNDPARSATATTAWSATQAGEFLVWMEQLDAALDCCCWMLHTGVISLHELLAQLTDDSGSSEGEHNVEREEEDDGGEREMLLTSSAQQQRRHRPSWMDEASIPDSSTVRGLSRKRKKAGGTTPAVAAQARQSTTRRLLAATQTFLTTYFGSSPSNASSSSSSASSSSSSTSSQNAQDGMCGFRHSEVLSSSERAVFKEVSARVLRRSLQFVGLLISQTSGTTTSSSDGEQVTSFVRQLAEQWTPHLQRAVSLGLLLPQQSALPSALHSMEIEYYIPAAIRSILRASRHNADLTQQPARRAIVHMVHDLPTQIARTVEAQPFAQIWNWSAVRLSHPACDTSASTAYNSDTPGVQYKEPETVRRLCATYRWLHDEAMLEDVLRSCTAFSADPDDTAFGSGGASHVSQLARMLYARVFTLPQDATPSSLKEASYLLRLVFDLGFPVSAPAGSDSDCENDASPFSRNTSLLTSILQAAQATQPTSDLSGATVEELTQTRDHARRFVARFRDQFGAVILRGSPSSSAHPQHNWNTVASDLTSRLAELLCTSCDRESQAAEEQAGREQVVLVMDVLHVALDAAIAHAQTGGTIFAPTPETQAHEAGELVMPVYDQLDQALEDPPSSIDDLETLSLLWRYEDVLLKFLSLLSRVLVLASMHMNLTGRRLSRVARACREEAEASSAAAVSELMPMSSFEALQDAPFFPLLHRFLTKAVRVVACTLVSGSLNPATRVRALQMLPFFVECLRANAPIPVDATLLPFREEAPPTGEAATAQSNYVVDASGSSEHVWGLKDVAALAINAVETMVCDCFPMTSSEVKPGTVEHTTYSTLLKGYLRLMGEHLPLALLPPLFGNLQEGTSHTHAQLLRTTVVAMADTLHNLAPVTVADEALSSSSLSGMAAASMLGGPDDDNEGAEGGTVPAKTLAVPCAERIAAWDFLMQVMADETVRPDVSERLLDELCLRSMRHADLPTLLCFFVVPRAGVALSSEAAQQAQQPPGSDGSSGVPFVCHLVDVIKSSFLPHIGNSAALHLQAVIHSTAYRLLETLHDAIPPRSLKGAVADAFAPNDRTSLTKTICRTVDARLNTGYQQSSCLTPSDRLKVMSAAFSCVCIVVAKTQRAKNLFDGIIVKRLKVLLPRVVDSEATFSFDTRTDFEQTVVGGMNGSALAPAHVFSQQRDRETALRSLVQNNGWMGHYLRGDLVSQSSLVQGEAGSTLEEDNDRFAFDDEEEEEKQDEKEQEQENAMQGVDKHAGGERHGDAHGGTNGRRLRIGRKHTLGRHIAHATSSSAMEELSQGGGIDDDEDATLLPEGRGLVAGDTVGESIAQFHAMGAGTSSAARGGLVSAVPGPGAAGGTVDDEDAELQLNDLIVLELSDLNRHPCMVALMRFIWHMDGEFGRTDKDTPLWVQTIVDILGGTDPSEQNIRLFLCQLLLNQPIAQASAPWAHQLLLPLLEFTSHELVYIGAGFHYMVRDVCLLLTDTESAWAGSLRETQDVNLSPISVALGRLITRLLSVVWNETMNITTNNLRLVVSLLGLWNTMKQNEQLHRPRVHSRRYPLNIDPEPILQLLRASAAQTGGAHGRASSEGTHARNKRTTGLHLLAMLIDAEEERFDHQSLHADELLDDVVKCLSFPRAEVSELSARVAGTVLYRLLPAPGVPTEEHYRHLCHGARDFQERLRDVVRQLHSDKKYKEMVICCRRIGWETVSFLDREILVKLLSVVTHIDAKHRALLLELFARYVEVAELQQPNHQGPQGQHGQHSEHGAAASTGTVPTAGLGVTDIFQHVVSHLPMLLSDVTTRFSRTQQMHVPIVQLATLRLLRRLAPHLTLPQILSVCPLSGDVEADYERAAVEVEEAEMQQSGATDSGASLSLDVGSSSLGGGAGGEGGTGAVGNYGRVRRARALALSAAGNPGAGSSHSVALLATSPATFPSCQREAIGFLCTVLERNCHVSRDTASSSSSFGFARVQGSGSKNNGRNDRSRSAIFSRSSRGEEVKEEGVLREFKHEDGDVPLGDVEDEDEDESRGSDPGDIDSDGSRDPEEEDEDDDDNGENGGPARGSQGHKSSGTQRGHSRQHHQGSKGKRAARTALERARAKQRREQRQKAQSKAVTDRVADTLRRRIVVTLLRALLETGNPAETAAAAAAVEANSAAVVTNTDPNSATSAPGGAGAVGVGGGGGGAAAMASDSVAPSSSFGGRNRNSLSAETATTSLPFTQQDYQMFDLEDEQDVSASVRPVSAGSTHSRTSAGDSGDDSAHKRAYAGSPQGLYSLFRHAKWLPSQIAERLLVLMRDMYDPSFSREWLRYSACLLLMLPMEQRESYNAPLFEQSLGDCAFQTVDLSTATLSSQSMTPAFTLENTRAQSQTLGPVASGPNASLAFSASAVGTLSRDAGVRQEGFIRATQEVGNWTQTQFLGEQAFGLTQVHNYAAAGGMGQDFGPHLGFHMGSVGPAATRGHGLSQQQSQSHNPAAASAAGGMGSSSTPVPSVMRFGAPGSRAAAMQKIVMGGKRMRFSRYRQVYGIESGRSSEADASSSLSSSGSTAGSANPGRLKDTDRSEMLRQMSLRRAQQRSQRQRNERQKRIVTFRKYRVGEVPDIQIPLKDIVQPWQGLVLFDAPLAKRTFVMLATELYVYGEVENLPSAATLITEPGTGLGDRIPGHSVEDTEYRQSFRRLQEDMLETLPDSPDLVSALLECVTACLRAISVQELEAEAGRLRQQRDAVAVRAFNDVVVDDDGDGDDEYASPCAVPDPPEAWSSMSLLNPRTIADAALRTMSLHSGIVVLEEQLAWKEVVLRRENGGNGSRRRTNRAATSKRSSSGLRSKGGRSAGATRESDLLETAHFQLCQEWWTQLARLYAALGEHDVLVGLVSRSSHQPLVREAVDAELAGDYEHALELYDELQQQEPSASWGSPEKAGDPTATAAAAATAAHGRVSREELSAWDLRQFDCFQNLLQWDELQHAVLSNTGTGGDPNLLWLEAHRSRHLGYYVSSVVHRRGEHPRDLDRLLQSSFYGVVNDAGGTDVSAVVEAASVAAAIATDSADTSFGADSPRDPTLGASVEAQLITASTKRAWLEQNHAADMALAFLHRQDFANVRLLLSQAYNKFMETWGSFNECAVGARRLCLQQLQSLADMADYIDALADTRFRKRARRVHDLAMRWRRSTPSPHHDGILVWNAAAETRRECLDQWDRAQGEYLQAAGFLLSPLHAAQLDTRLHLAWDSLHRFYQKAAGCALAQGVFSVAQMYIARMNDLTAKVGKQAILYAGAKMPPGALFTSLEWNRARYNQTSTTAAGRAVCTKTLKFLAKRMPSLIGDGAPNHGNGSDDDERVPDGDDDDRSDGDRGDETPGEQSRVHGVAYAVSFGMHFAYWLEQEGVLTVAAQESEQTGVQLPALRAGRDAVAIDRVLAMFSKAVGLADAHASPLASLVKSRREAWAYTAGEAHLALAQFCERVLRASSHVAPDVRTPSAADELTPLAEQCVQHVLQSMTHGCIPAIDRFPGLLGLIRRFPETRSLFSERALEVAPWMYLRWLDQCLGVLDGEEGPAVLEVLLHIAQRYPRALYYPFSMTKRQFSPAVRTRTAQLEVLLQNPTMECFIQALEGLHNPALRLEDAARSAGEHVSAGDPTAARALWQDACETILALERSLVGSKIGHENRKFAQRWRKQKTQWMNMPMSKTSIREVRTRLKQDGGRDSGKKPLSFFSEWLAEFDRSNGSVAAAGALSAEEKNGASECVDCDLEIPGLYTGEQCPREDLHPRVSRFGDTLLIMNSMRRPKRLEMHATDEKSYKFLVKGGEDLRNDQRIEQLFDLMNTVLGRDMRCSKSALRLTTYAVVPMSPEIGVLEWVDNTEPLKSIVMSELAADPIYVRGLARSGAGGSERRKAGGAAAAGPVVDLHHAPAYKHWCKSYLGLNEQSLHKSSDARLYLSQLNKVGYDTAVRAFADVCERIPDSLLRRRLIRMADAPEVFVAARSQFARSLATLSVATYILGIGDRHLDNYLVDKCTGSLVAIDFGYSFGLSASVLPVPEFLPFRLSPNMLGALHPLDSRGLLRHWMVHVMRAFRDSQDILRTTMEVYLNEPVLDWIKGKQREDRAQGEARADVAAAAMAAALATELPPEQAAMSTASASSSGGRLGAAPEPVTDRDLTEPERKIAQVLRKLRGCNPCVVLLNDLERSVSLRQQRAFESVKDIVRGTHDPESTRWSETGNWRSTSLPVPKQVDALLELATDGNVLVRHWQGLNVWV